MNGSVDKRQKHKQLYLLLERLIFKQKYKYIHMLMSRILTHTGNIKSGGKFVGQLVVDELIEWRDQLKGKATQ